MKGSIDHEDDRHRNITLASKKIEKKKKENTTFGTEIRAPNYSGWKILQ